MLKERRNGKPHPGAHKWQQKLPRKSLHPLQLFYHYKLDSEFQPYWNSKEYIVMSVRKIDMYISNMLFVRYFDNEYFINQRSTLQISPLVINKIYLFIIKIFNKSMLLTCQFSLQALPVGISIWLKFRTMLKCSKFYQK